MDAMSEPISVERLRHILTRIGLAVANIRAEKREIVIDLGTPDGSAVEATIFMVGYDDFSKPWVKAPGCLFCEADECCLGVLNCYARTFGLAGLKPFGASPLKKVFPITEATLRLMSPLSKALAQANPIPQHCSITLSLISPKGLPSDQKAVSFSSFFPAVPRIFIVIMAGQ
jgi:hypothetical protein